MRSGRRVLAVAATFVAVAVVSIAVALLITPARSVSAFGQTVAVGTAPPSLSAAGPGELVLFGQTMPTTVRFLGPIRPRLVLTTIDLNEQVAASFTPGPHAPIASTLGAKLVAGWRAYFLVEIAFVALVAVVLLGAIAGWRRSLEQLVGQSAGPPVAPAPGPTLPQVEAVVLGDSTAAGVGGPPPADASPRDILCGRSSFAFASTLARVNDWNVENLACSGASIREGVLGPQVVRGQEVPAQLAVAKRAVDASTVIVAVGANDLGWSSFLRLCAVVDSCNNRAVDAYFQRSLETFTRSYLELLRQLATLPNDPRIVIVQYYVPFDPTQDCLADTGITSAKMAVLVDRLRALNTVLATGAETFGYVTAAPDFSGHELCTEQPYVQGPTEPAPLHPNARGELLIALTIERAILASG